MRTITTFMLCLCLSGCGLFQQEPEPTDKEEPKSLYIGQIASVHASQGFVLIRRIPGITVESGTILIAEGIGGAASNLRVSGESLGQMLAADIQSGTPQAGDSVRKPLIQDVDLEEESSESSL